MINQHEGQYAIEMMCSALGVSESGYYAWRKREPSIHAQEDQRIVAAIRRIHQDSRQLYGSPRIHAMLQREGIRCSRKRVARLMQEHGIFSRRRPKRRIKTTDSQHDRPVAPNLLKRDFSANAPNQKWVGDILGIWTLAGWIYLAALLDTFSRMIVGWAMSPYRDEDLVTMALHMAIARRHLFDADEFIHHTDRGSQYTAYEYQATLASTGILISMSGKADPYDNAMVESFFSTLRAECTDLSRFKTHAEARLAVFDFIELFYNRQRLHSSLDYLSPAEFEDAYVG